MASEPHQSSRPRDRRQRCPSGARTSPEPRATQFISRRRHGRRVDRHARRVVPAGERRCTAEAFAGSILTGMRGCTCSSSSSSRASRNGSRYRRAAIPARPRSPGAATFAGAERGSDLPIMTSAVATARAAPAPGCAAPPTPGCPLPVRGRREVVTPPTDRRSHRGASHRAAPVEPDWSAPARHLLTGQAQRSRRPGLGVQHSTPLPRPADTPTTPVRRTP